MSFQEVLAELPSLSLDQRQILILKALELDDVPLDADDEALIDKRLESHHRHPETALSMDEMVDRLRKRQ